jgi:hydroxylamine reductase
MSEEKDNKITKEMTMAEIVEKDPEAAFRLMDMGMMCGGCPVAQFETLEDGCAVHGADVDEVIKQLEKDDS